MTKMHWWNRKELERQAYARLVRNLVIGGGVKGDKAALDASWSDPSYRWLATYLYRTQGDTAPGSGLYRPDRSERDGSFTESLSLFLLTMYFGAVLSSWWWLPIIWHAITH